LLGNSEVVVWSLLLGGIFLIVFELFHKAESKSLVIEELENISYKQSLLIGVFQSIAMVPGVSRSAATIIGGLTLGLKRKTIVEFSFLLAVPTMLSAASLDLIKTHNVFSLSQVLFLVIGFITSFIVAIFSIKLLLRFIKNNNFIVFGVYRIVLSIVWFVV
jgi:undecaprenyl-diphosphatase